MVRGFFAGFVVCSAVVVLGYVSLALLRSWFDGPEDYGVTESEVYVLATSAELASYDLPAGATIEMVAYGGGSCGGIVKISRPESGSALWLVGEDSGAPVMLGRRTQMGVTEAKRELAENRPLCDFNA